MGVSLEVYRAAIGHHYFQLLFRHAGVNHVNDRHAPNQSPCGRLQIKDHRQSSIGRYVAPILLCVTITLLLLSGDVEINPGPQCPNCKAETVGTIMNRGSPQRMSFPPSCIHCKRDFRGVTVQVRELAWEMRPMCKTFCPCLENSSKLLELVIDIEQPYELLDLPLELFDLAEVEILVIRAVGTWTVPGALRRLVNIKCIFLEVKQLQWLEVYRRSQPLTRIPGSLALDLPAGLVEFSARMCNLLALPPGFACLRSLQVLDISRNKVVNLRPSLSCLTNLMFVDVSYNPFENLTANFPFTSCYQIQALNLDGTGLSGIPWLPNMTSLSHLSLAGNRLKSLPSWFSRLTSLTSLNLSSNRLSMLPHLVSHICNLQVLDVCCNPFLSLCADLRSILTSLCNLRILMLRDTGLSELPRSITALPDLRRLDVGQNDISALPKFGCQRNMLTVHVEGNPMALYPGWMQDRLLRVVFDSDSSTGLVGTPELPRLKLVVLGNTMAGKTSLIRSMQCCKTVLVKEEDRTVALEQFDLVRQSNHVTQFENIGSNVMKSLSRWLSGPDKFVRLLFRVCDCGGQDAYLLTSQMFLSRSMFVIIAADVSEYDCTEETFQRLIGRYLNMVYARAKKAVVLMVLTKVDLLDLRNTSEHSESRPPFGIRRDRRRGLRMVKGKVEHRCVEDRDFEGFEDELLAAITGEQLAGTTGRSVPSQVLEDDDIICCYESDIFLRANRMQDHRKEQIKEEIRSLQEDTAFSSDPLVQETIADLRYQHEHQPENVRLLTGSSGVDIDRKHNGHTRERKPLEIHHADFSETFANALSKAGRELVTSPSPDTLKLEETMLGIAQERHTPILSIADVEEALRLANVNSSLDGLRSSVDRLEDEGSIFSCSVSSADGRDQKIFPDIPWLVKVIKAIFRHDHGERLTFVEFKRRYNGPKYVSETEFCSMKYQLIQEGKISSELLHVLWSDLEENHVDNLLQVIIKLNLCCIMPPSRADARGSVLDRLNSGSAVMYIPWLLPDTLPEALVLRADLWRMDQSRSLDCTVSCSYDFRDFVPVGMFEMFMAKLHNSLLGAEEVYMWKTGMVFRYGPIEALIRCVSDISSQVVVMQARIIDLGSNVTRLWHVLYRCILWLEQQLKTTPNVIIRRYLAFQPVVGLRGGPRFDTRYRVLLETGECPNVVVTQLPVDLNRKHMTTLNTDVVSTVRDGVDLLFAVPASCASTLTDKDIRALARHPDVQSRWEDFSHELLEPVNATELSSTVRRVSDRKVILDVIEMWQNRIMLLGGVPMVCLLYDALVAIDLTELAQKLFGEEVKPAKTTRYNFQAVGLDLNKEPSREDIDLIANERREQWRRFGFYLGLSVPELDQIQYRLRYESKYDMLFRVIIDWTRREVHPTLRALKEVCEKLDARP